jgi:hypothetical protein
MTEFVPERTAAYISQHDLHIGEMTVRETLAFSARCQGWLPLWYDSEQLVTSAHAYSFVPLAYYVGFDGFADMLIKFCFFPFMLLDMLTELSRREKAANIKPDADIDAFMKASER